MTIRRSGVFIVLLAALLLTSCTGGGGSNTPTEPAIATLVATIPPENLPTLDAGVQPPEPSAGQGATQAEQPTPSMNPSGVATLPLVESTPAGSTLPNASEFPNPQDFILIPVTSGLDIPVNITPAFDNSGRMFVNEKPGRIRILQSGELLPQPFLDITDRVGSASSEQGLLGLAFHPQYAQNGRFFVYYTDKNGDSVLSRFQVSAGDPNQADPASEVVLLTQDQPFPNHNGGQLTFGPDGYLYLGLGDGGSAGDPQNNGQSVDTLLGKILRLDVDQGETYGIPADNPFAGGGGRPEIWAYGLRNPWRFSFDRQTGEMYIADVGQNQWEEINYLPAGATGGTNFGWRFKEGTHPYKEGAPADALLVDPVFEYDHSLGCSVTGGYVYRGSMPEWQGIYLFGDYCGGRTWMMMRQNDRWVAMEAFYTGLGLTAFGQDEAGEIYFVDGAGSVLRLGKQ